jgi:hypothetical protein
MVPIYQITWGDIPEVNNMLHGHRREDSISYNTFHLYSVPTQVHQALVLGSGCVPEKVGVNKKDVNQKLSSYQK